MTPFVRAMTPDLLCSLIIRPVLGHLGWPQPLEREVLLCAIACQESGLRDRRQMPSGPAKSFWQIEPATAMDCIRRHKPVSGFWIALGQGYDTSDQVACAVAAGILRLHPGKLPKLGDQQGAWKYYLDSWRPGAPRPESWPRAYHDAMATAG